MKKQILTIFAALTVGAVVAQQNPSPSWTISQNAAFTNTSVGIKFMDAVDNNVMWVTGYNGFAPSENYNWFSRTINGGSTYTAGNILPDTNTWILANLEGVDANTAWVSMYNKPAGAQGTVYRTTNGGATWSNMNNGNMFTNANAFTDFVTFLTPSVGVVVGDPVNAEYEIWRTTNGGASWTQIPGVNIPNPLAGEFAIVNVYCKQGNSNIWFGTNLGRMYRSTDGGITWNVSTVGTTSSFITDVAFNTPLNGVAYANNGGLLELYNSTNGGVSWTQITPVPANVGVNDVCAVPGSNAFVSAGAGTGNQLISYSTNNGLTWTDFGSTGIQYLVADFANNTTGWSGSFSDNAIPSLGGIWKYNGAAFSGTISPTSAFTIPSDLCLSGASASVQPVNSSSGSPVLTYSWSAVPAGVAFATSTSSAPVITFTANNTYTIVCVVTNSVGSNSSSQVITVQACNSPTAAFTVASNPCNNVTFTTSNTSTGAPTPIYSWSSNPSVGVNFLPSPNATNPSVNITTAGSYTLTLVATNASGTAQATQVVTVANCNPVVAFAIPTIACSGAAVTTSNTTTGATTYTWSTVPNTGVFQINAAGNNKTYNFTNPGNYTITLKASNASGTAQAVHTLSVDACVGIFENTTLAADLVVFPNPAHEVLTLVLPNTSESFNISLVNVLGSVVFEETVSKSTKENYSINLANKAKGVYFLTVESKNEKLTKKIIVE